MTSHVFGAVVLAVIPYSDQIQTKQRPAVVVSSPTFFDGYGDLILLGITSQIKPIRPFENLQITEWEKTGLPKPSMFKPGLFTLESNKIKRVFGVLGDDDTFRLKKLLAEMLVLS